MSEVSGEIVPEVVRARRFEVVDDAGRVRVVVGPVVAGDPYEGALGLSLMNEGGERRVAVAVAEDGSWAALELGGNTLIHLGINEPGSDAVDARAFLYLCDADGLPVVGWRVADDGGLLEERPQDR